MAEEDFKEGFIHFCNSAVYFIFDIVSLDISSNCRHFNGSQLLRLINATSSFPYVFRLQYPRASTLYNSSNPKIGNICPIRKEKSSRIPFRFKIINKSFESHAVLPFSKSKFLIFIVKISLNSLDCIRYFLENSLKFH